MYVTNIYTCRKCTVWSYNNVFASPSKSRIRVLQSIGRGLRQSKDKDSVKLFDIADDLTYKTKRNFT